MALGCYQRQAWHGMMQAKLAYISLQLKGSRLWSQTSASDPPGETRQPRGAPQDVARRGLYPNVIIELLLYISGLDRDLAAYILVIVLECSQRAFTSLSPTAFSWCTC